jgi:hypothetical protein
MVRKWLGSALLALIAAGVAATVACGTDAVGIQTCRQIEEARCHGAPNCPNIALGTPVHRGTSPAAAVDACIRYYDDACLHGLAASDPGATTTKACVDAINQRASIPDCDALAKPETIPECAWLTPPPPAAPADAGDAGDAANDGAVDAPPLDAGFDVFSLFDDAGI